MEILSGYGLGNNLKRLIQQFCDEQSVVWSSLGKMMRREGADIKVLLITYRGMVYAVLLFGSESWILLTSIEKQQKQGTPVSCAKSRGIGTVEHAQDVGDTSDGVSAGSSVDAVHDNLHWPQTGDYGSVGGYAPDIQIMHKI